MFKKIVFDLYSFGKLAANKRNEKSANETINTINSIVTVLIDELKVIQNDKSNNMKDETVKLDFKRNKRLIENIIADPIHAVRNIGKVAIEKELRQTPELVIEFINDICLEMISLKSISNAMFATNALKWLGMLCLRNKLEFEILTIIDNLEEIRKLSYENKLDRVTNIAIRHHDEINKIHEKMKKDGDLEF